MFLHWWSWKLAALSTFCQYPAEHSGLDRWGDGVADLHPYSFAGPSSADSCGFSWGSLAHWWPNESFQFCFAPQKFESLVHRWYLHQSNLCSVETGGMGSGKCHLWLTFGIWGSHGHQPKHRPGWTFCFGCGIGMDCSSPDNFLLYLVRLLVDGADGKLDFSTWSGAEQSGQLWLVVGGLGMLSVLQRPWTSHQLGGLSHSPWLGGRLNGRLAHSLEWYCWQDGGRCQWQQAPFISADLSILWNPIAMVDH